MFREDDAAVRPIPPAMVAAVAREPRPSGDVCRTKDVACGSK